LGSLRLYRSCATVDHLYITADIIKPKTKNIENLKEKKEILNRISGKVVLHINSLEIIIKDL